MRQDSTDAGFSLAELLIATTIILIISTVVTSGLLQMSNSQRTIWNRTEMHSGVRSATELLQQEVGQAGRVALPGSPTVTAGGGAGSSTVTLSSVSGIYVGEKLVIGTGSTQETAVVSAVNTNTNVVTISGTLDYSGTSLGTTFASSHAAAEPIAVTGGFKTGIIPPAAVGFTNGSTPSVLKMYGDINGDGNMVYVEYKCDTAGGNLYRNSVAYDSATKPSPGPAQILLSNITTNPNLTGCFQYQLDSTNSYVLDVAITMTVNSQQLDPITKKPQTETKALLNVSPRNVFDTWKLQGSYPDRVQDTPPTVTSLIAITP